MKILFRHGPALVLGPLGCYERGQHLDSTEGKLLVTNVDYDGAGVAFPIEFLETKAMDDGKTYPETVQEWARYRSRSCKDPGTASERQQEQMTKTILYNRRKAGLSEIDPREAKPSF